MVVSTGWMGLVTLVNFFEWMEACGYEDERDIVKLNDIVKWKKIIKYRTNSKLCLILYNLGIMNMWKWKITK